MKNWFPGITLEVDPESILDYELDFTGWLEGGVIGAAVVFTEGCDANAPTIAGNTVKVRMFNLLRKGFLTLRISTTDGQRDDFTIKFKARQK